MDKDHSYDEERMKLQKLYIRKIGAEAEVLNLEAEVKIAQYGDASKMMDDALRLIDKTKAELLKLPDASKWIDLNKYIRSLTDANEIRNAELQLCKELELLSDYRKQYKKLIWQMYQLLEACRQDYKNNDPIQTIRLFPNIRQMFKFTHELWQRIQEIEGGGKGGRKGQKRSIWAESLAEKLNTDYPHLKKSEAWKKIPSTELGSADYWDIPTKDADYQIYRDGETLLAINEVTRKEFSIKRDTFFDKYYKKPK